MDPSGRGVLENVIERTIAMYSKETDQLEREVVLENIELSDLKTIFPNSKDDDQLVMVYPIGLAQKLQLEHLIGQTIENDGLDIFLEAHKVL